MAWKRQAASWWSWSYIYPVGWQASQYVLGQGVAGASFVRRFVQCKDMLGPVAKYRPLESHETKGPLQALSMAWVSAGTSGKHVDGHLGGQILPVGLHDH